jgi:16S rRNA (guanine527-N7)-methyltransferase
MAFDEASCRGAISDLPGWTQQLGLDLTPSMIENYVRYCRLLLESNNRFNLTAVNDPAGVVQRHFLDSLTINLAIPGRGSVSQRVMDVGSGGGFPGLALAIAYPQWSVSLLEAVGKKARFLEETAWHLNLERVNVVCQRAESFGRSSGRDSYDIACARAVASLPALVEYCAPLVHTGGLLVFYKSGDVAVEVATAARALDELNCRFVSIVRVPDWLPVGHAHKLVVFKKTAPTSDRYPRRVGMPRSRPL